MEKLYIVSKKKTGSLLWLRSWTPEWIGLHELMNLAIAKFRCRLKKVGKTTRPFRCDLNQVHYDYTVEVRNSFKGLDLMDREPDELWTRFMTLYRRQWSRPSSRKRNAKRLNGCLRRPYKYLWKEEKWKAKGERKDIIHLNVEFQRIARRDKKAFLSDQCKEIGENNRMGKTRDLFKKVRDTKGTFHAKTGSIKDRNGMDLTEAEDTEVVKIHIRTVLKRYSQPR